MSSILGVGGGAGLVVGGADRGAPELALAVLDPARDHAGRRVRHLEVHPRVAGAHARPGQLAGRRADDGGHLRDPHRHRPDRGLGLGRHAHAGAVRGRRRVLRGLGHGRGAQPRAAGRHDDDAPARRVDHEPGGVPARRRPVRVVHRLPAVRPAAQEHRLRLRRVGGDLEPVPPPRRADGMGLVGSAAGRIAGRYGSKAALVAGTAITAVAFAFAGRGPRRTRGRCS